MKDHGTYTIATPCQQFVGESLTPPCANRRDDTVTDSPPFEEVAEIIRKAPPPRTASSR